MSVLLPMFGDLPAARAGDVYVLITAPTPQVLPPKFSVVGRGGHIIVNQETKPVLGSFVGVGGFVDPSRQSARTADNERFSGDPSEQDNRATIDFVGSNLGDSLGLGVSGASGIGSFAGANVGGAFSAAAAQQFVGRFHVFKEDGLFHMDGLARVVVHPQGLCSTAAGSADSKKPEEECPGELQVPPGVSPPDFLGTSGFSAAVGSPGPWNSANFPSWMTIDLASNDVVIAPSISPVPFKLTMGALAQPFSLPASVSGDVKVRLKLARREVPGWLSSFSSRRVLIEVIKDFFSATPTVIAAKYVPAGDLPEVSFDPVTGLMIEPASMVETS
ncbi:MAG: hypothetical protein Q8R28_21890, partial [Dehalococcoidia bacterium]|nr:hypothetical protein [Dehalococcoidia bacterium]